MVSTTVWVGGVTARAAATLGTAVFRVVEIVLASTLPAWVCTVLLWLCRVA